MNVTIIAGLLTVITLALGVFMAVQMIQAVTPPMPPTAGDVGKGAIKHAADLLRQKATEIQNNGVVPDPPRSNIVDRLNSIANQIGNSPPGFIIPPCPPEAIRFCD